MQLLEAINLSTGYHGKAILNKLNFNIAEGELIALLGCNGVGKSTLLRTLTAELSAITGSIKIFGEDLTSMSRRRMAQLLAIVTTEQLQIGALTVYELVSLGRDPHTGYSGRLSSIDHEMIKKSMLSVGIYNKKDSYVAELSDGERQKAMIARALAQDTPLIILDEPFSFLDVSARVEILGMLKRLCKDTNKGILYSSHDVSQSLRMSDRIFMFTPDRNFINGTPKEIIDNNLISQLFSTDGVIFDPSQNDFIART